MMMRILNAFALALVILLLAVASALNGNAGGFHGLQDSAASCTADSDFDRITPVTACFLESSSFTRPLSGKFDVEDINSTLCTHVVYCYADLNEATNKIDVAHADGHYRRLTVLKEENPNLKITVATGGWEVGAERYSKMAASKDARDAFISSVVDLLRLYKLDGLDIDWRDPGTRGGLLEDKENYVQLCKELKQEFLKFGWQLTVTVSGRIFNIDLGYDLPGLAEHTDYFYLLTYDYHGAWDGYMGHTAPLYPRMEESGSQRELNVNFTVATILSRGIPATKLVMGITLYAHIYHYTDVNNKGFGATTIWKDSLLGPYTKDAGKMGYNELCEMLQSEGSSWTDDWQDEHKVPYITRNNISISYDNERSIDIRIRFAESLGLRGAFVLAVNADDFRGYCGHGRYPQLTLINSKISAISSSSRSIRDCPTNEEPVSPIVACFLESWSANRPSFGQFSIEHIDATLCTHVVYCYARLNQITQRIEFADRMTDAGTFDRLRTLKTVNPRLKITVAIGGSGEPSTKFSNMVASETTRSIFIESAVEFLRKHQLDGLDLDWRDPATKGGRRPDKLNYVLLCQALKQDFRKYGWQLTVTISGRLYNLNAGYDLEGLAMHADYLYLLSYEYHGYWETVTGHSAPLYPRRGETGPDLEYNVNFTVSTILSRGVPASKIVMGIFLYGKIYRLESAFNTWTGAAAIKNNDFTGPYTRELVYMGYNEICEILHEKGVKWTTNWDSDHKVSYIYENDVWISYENERSIKDKMDYSEALNLRGAFVWAVDSDDFRGRCGAGPYPLLTLVYNKTQIAAEKHKPTGNATDSIVACFLDSWSVYRSSFGQFNVEDIDVNLCTHIIYCFAGLDETTNTIISLDPDISVQSGAFRRVVLLKKKKPSLVITVSIGGYAEGSGKFSLMAARLELRRTFIASVVKFLKETGFDGMDLAWVSPADRGGRPEDKANLVQLCKEIRSAFSRTGWTFTVSLYGWKYILDKGYDLPAIAKEIDLFYVLAYDYHGFWDGVTGHPSPLKPIVWEEGQMEDTVEYSVSYFTIRSVPIKKIVLVVNFFGRTFKLKEASNNGLGAPAHSLGFSGAYSQNEGFIGYNELCETISEEGSLWTITSDPLRGLPYMYRDDYWMAYDNITTIGEKAALAKHLELAGVGVWTVSTDDFRGRCGRGKFPLLTQVNKVLGKIAVNNSTKSTFNISGISGIWCSVAEQANVTVDVLQCGLSDERNCIVDNKVPPQTVVFASCWRTTDLVMKCLPDGYWIPQKDFQAVLEDLEARIPDRMRRLCQPHHINSLICGRRPRYQRTSPTLHLGIFHEPKILWPWVVELYDAENYICCASIVSVHYLLTAAHCVARSRETSSDTLDVNRLTVKMTGSFEAKVSDIQLHPEYRSEKNQLVKDIAMLKLSEPLTFDSDLYPACVSFMEDLPEQTAVAFNRMPRADHLFQYNGILQSLDKDCSASSELCSRPLDRSMSQFCGLSEDGVSILQSGSSGGPFMQDLSSRTGEEQWTVTGVVSFSSESPDCFIQHTIYTAVHSVRSWIKEITQRLHEDSSLTAERE